MTKMIESQSSRVLRGDKTEEEATLSGLRGRRVLPVPGHGECLIGKEEMALVNRVLERRQLFRYYGSDPDNPPRMTDDLESEFRKKMGVGYALAVTSGTAALETAMGALGLGPGDEVILPVWGWISCYSAIVRMGAKPVFAEIDDSLNLDIEDVSRRITPYTKAVLVVHLQGVATEMDALMPIAREAGLKVIEDCASSVGVSYKGKRIGSIGDMGIYSFQNNKVITCGEGGMVVTNDSRLYERAVRMHDVGQYRPHHIRIKPPTERMFCGSNYRMSELSAAVALAQLRKLDKILTKLRASLNRLMEQISDLEGIRFRRVPDPEGQAGLELFMLMPSKAIAKRFQNELDTCRIPCRQRTGAGAHTAKDYVKYQLAHAESASPFRKCKEWPAPGYREQDFPGTSAIMERNLAVPIGVLYSNEDIDYIAAVIRNIHSRTEMATPG